MAAKVNAQKDACLKINKAYTNFRKTPKERLTELYAQARLTNLEGLWSQFLSNHQDILASCDDWEALQKSSYITDDIYEKSEEAYLIYKTELLKFIQKTTPQSVQTHSHTNTVLKLPKIVIPTFSGNYSEWVTFRDLFVSLVHSNSALDDVQRLHYLKGYLTGEAEKLVRQLPITATNYTECWRQLESRYNNKNYLANCLLKRLLDLKQSVTESASSVKELLDTTVDCLHGLKNIGIDTSTWDIIVIHIISNKLDKETRKQWEMKVSEKNVDELPNFQQFQDFLNSRYRALESVEPISRPKSSNPIVKHNQVKHKVLHATTQLSVACAYCSEDHKLFNCNMFTKENVSKRREFVFSNRICFNCLGSNHSARFCPSKSACRVCKGKHHSLLHPDGLDGAGMSQISSIGASTSGVSKNGSTTRKADNSSVVEGSASAVVSCFGQLPIQRRVFLATAIVMAESSKGDNYYIRALLDQGSQASFVSEATVQHLGIRKYPVKGIVSGLEGNKTITARHMVELKIHSRVDFNIAITVQAYVLKSITTFLPNQQMVKLDWLDQDMFLADPQYHTPSKIDILLGADIYGQVVEEGIKKGPEGYTLAQATSLGWILSGGGQEAKSPNVISLHLCMQDDMLKKFWEIEADPRPHKKMMSEEEVCCEQFYADTTTRDADGRYIVRLPFKTDRPACVDGDSRAVAEKRLNGLHARFKKDPQLKEKYTEVMTEYLNLGFMEKVPEEEKVNKNSVYIPHHPVIRNDKDTTRVRVVYDASCKYKNGISLNSTLMVGPTLQMDLRHLLMRWRQHSICLAADIIKMYCQVKVAHEDTDYQRLLWKDNPDAKAEDYRLLRVTFGTASAPYLAVKSLQRVGEDEGAQFPAAAKIVSTDVYMDDVLTGCSSVEEGIKIQKELTELLRKGCFELQKWTSNSDELLEAIKQGKDDMQEEIRLKTDEVVKLLGLTWNRQQDDFRYSVTLPQDQKPVTKRIIISQIARLYDPSGWAAPCVITAKILIQKLWIAGLEWDQEVTGNLLREWETYREGLHLLTQIRIPRWLRTSHDDSIVELHGFADASQLAYAAVVYLRIVDASGNVHVSLVTAKTKVAPIKQISIPRLELCGAVLVAKLLVEVAEILEVPRSNIRAWTDSMVVLAWLNSHPSKWQTFVANRVSEILTTVDSRQWAHISSGQNPADCASRGVTPAELLNHSMWFNGPDFLQREVIVYSKPQDTETQLEERQVKVKAHIAVEEDLPIGSRYSSLTKLIRVVAYCRRFLKLKKLKGKYLTTPELKEALEVCVKQCQQENFEAEMEVLRKDGRQARLKAPLKSLNPFIDDKGIMRVGGRLGKSSFDEGVKHPILLPKRSTFTGLVIADAHTRTLHGGIQLMLAYLGTKYYILGAKPAVKAYIRKCVKCIRYNAQSASQLMGELPAARVTPTRPFKCSGVDYAGPVNIRTTKGRGYHAYKGYICLFVCMVTRAVHIEVVSDLTTAGFLAAFKRFVARRGQCTDIWSDNGTNFVGASRELQNLVAAENATLFNDVAKALAVDGTTWHFIPPRSPNFGGLWEAGIKSTKFHLKRIIGDSTLTYEELSTVLVQIEACLNSRPLSRLESESDSISVLTPGHFLVGEPLVTSPDYNYESSNIGSLRRWQLTQKLMQQFWKRWSQEYITKFLHRYKWAYQTPEPSVGDIVLVKEEDLPPCRWLLGRVVTKHPGTDNITRVVTLRTKNQILKRPTSKLCILPVAD